MFVRVTRNKKGDAYYHLVESFRDHGKVRQRLVLSLGRVEDGMLEKVAAALNKHLDTIQVLDLAKHIDIENAYVKGCWGRYWGLLSALSTGGCYSYR